MERSATEEVTVVAAMEAAMEAEKVVVVRVVERDSS